MRSDPTSSATVAATGGVAEPAAGAATAPAPATGDALAEVLSRLADAIASRGGVEPEALTAEQAAKFLGISTAKLHDLNARGLMPRPVCLGLGNCPRHLKSELRAWLLAGAPSRAKWDEVRGAAIRRVG